MFWVFGGLFFVYFDGESFIVAIVRCCCSAGDVVGYGEGKVVVNEGVFVHCEGEVGGAVAGIQEFVVAGEGSLLCFYIDLNVLNFLGGEWFKFEVGGVVLGDSFIYSVVVYLANLPFDVIVF